METRILVAYVLLALMVFAAVVGVAGLYRQRRRKRRRIGSATAAITLLQPRHSPHHC